MGLDMYAMVTCEEIDTEIDVKIDSAHALIHQWRKHPNRHGWMEQLYRRKGGTAEKLNQIGLKLTMSDLRALEQAVDSGTLPETQGFLFGQSDGTEYEDDLVFLHKAMNAIDNGLSLYYFAWW